MDICSNLKRYGDLSGGYACSPDTKSSIHSVLRDNFLAVSMEGNGLLFSACALFWVHSNRDLLAGNSSPERLHRLSGRNLGIWPANGGATGEGAIGKKRDICCCC